MKKKLFPKVFIIDVDGVLTTGHFFYSAEGKVMKMFGPDDNDALGLIKPFIKIVFVTGDKKGYEISKKRVVGDLGFPLNLVSTVKRIQWIENNYNPEEVIYMGDGIFDHYVFKKVGYAIATSNADSNAKKNAHYITERRGGERAVAEACLHILEKFFEPFDPEKLPAHKVKKVGEWNI